MDINFHSSEDVTVRCHLQRSTTFPILEDGKSLASKGIDLTTSRTGPTALTALRQHRDSKILTLETASFDATSPLREEYNVSFLRRGLYIFNPQSEWSEGFTDTLKVFLLAPIYILGNLGVRFLVQGVVYHFFKLLSFREGLEFLDRTLNSAHASRNRSYLKALAAIPLHIAITAVSLTFIVLIGSASYFNKMHGDVERWVNGHTFQDVCERSLNRRLREGLYFDADLQPVTALLKDSKARVFDVTQPISAIAEAQRRTFLNIAAKGHYRASAKPTLYDASGRVLDYPSSYRLITLFWRQISRISRLIRKIFTALFDLPIALLSLTTKVGTRKLPRHQKIVYVNGIHNSFLFAEGTAKTISKAAGGAVVQLTYNVTRGFFRDLFKYLRVARKKTASSTIVCDRLIHKIRKFHAKNRDNPNAKMLIVAHSGGTTEVRNALLSLKEGEGQRVIVIACAPSALIDPKLCHKVYHHAIQTWFRDPVPLFAIRHAPHLAQYVEWTTDPRWYADPHSLENKHYEAHIRRHTATYLALEEARPTEVLVEAS
jgi:hypothetical protein